jgi:undecaprenyl-diphosphatase
MIEKLIHLDKQLLVFLNGLGSPVFDGLWLMLTKQIYWLPLFLFLLYLVHKKIGLKQTLILLLFVTVLVAFTDQTTNLFKNHFQRLRPCNDPEINTIIRVVKGSNSFSFFSGHAANSSAVATFLFFNFRRKYPYFWLIFLWPLFFAYSRIYLGLHFPIDVLTGYIFGISFGFLMCKVYKIIIKSSNVWVE